MTKRSIDDPKFITARKLTDPLAALGDPRRLVLFSRLVRNGSPVALQTIKEDLKIHKVELSRILHRFEAARLVKLATGHDRTVTVTVNVETLHRLIGFLSKAYTALADPIAGEGTEPQDRDGVMPK